MLDAIIFETSFVIKELYRNIFYLNKTFILSETVMKNLYINLFNFKIYDTNFVLQ